MKPILEAVTNLAHQCLQFKDGEIEGFDMTMLESLLPIMLSPLQKELSDLKSKLEAANKELSDSEKFHSKRLDVALNQLLACEKEKERLEAVEIEWFERCSKLEKENKELKQWKESEMKIWQPVIDYAQHNKLPGLKLGDSISEYILKTLKSL